MTEAEVFILANNALNKVVQQIKDDQWGMKLPDWFKAGRTASDVDLKTIINYHAYDDAWVPDTLAGETIDEVGTKYDGDLLGDDPRASFAAIVEKSNAAVAAVTDFDNLVHLTYGDYPTREFLKHTTSFRGFRAYDVAKLIGTDTQLPADLVQGMWDEIAPEVEDWRKMGVFGSAIEVAADASLQTKLFALCGRQG